MTIRFINGVLSTIDITESTDSSNVKVATGTIKSDGNSLEIYDNDISDYIQLSGNLVITPNVTYGDTTSATIATANRVAINAAIDTATAAGGGIVRLLEGIVCVNGTGTASDGAVLLKDYVTLCGAGMGLTTIRAIDTGNDKLTGVVRTQSGIQNSYIHIHDLTIDGNKVDQTGTGDVTVFYAGVTPASSNDDTDVRCIRVECINGYNGSSNAGYGFDPHEVVNRLSLIDCIAHSNERDGFTIDGCINFNIDGCKSYSNGRHGFNFVTGSTNGTLSNPISYSNTDNGIAIQEDSSGINVVGGAVHSNSKEGILIKAGSTTINTNCEVTGVVVKENARDGITIRGASGNNIVNNRLIDNGTSGGTRYDVLIEGDGTNVATDNVVRSNHATAAGSNKTTYAYRQAAGTNAPSGNVIVDNYATGQTSGAIQIVSATGNCLARPFSYAVTTVPTASDWTGESIYVSNGAAGSAILAFSDGTNWLRSDTGAAIAAS